MWLLTSVAIWASAGRPLEWRLVYDDRGQAVALEAKGVPADVLARFVEPRKQFGPPLSQAIQVAVVDELGNASRTPLAGTVQIVDGRLRFEPRFAFAAEMSFRATARLSPLADSKATDSFSFSIPATKSRQSSARVLAVYPSAKELPENQLRFYVQFSEPMSRGESYRHVELRDAAGKPIELAFLEIGEELWNPSGTRLTLLIDPGRIKRGLKPREELGPVLETGKSYTLAVKASFPDGHGRPLRAPFEKSFRVGKPVDARIDVGEWRVHAPAAGSRETVRIEFPRPLDMALLKRTIEIVDADSKPIGGKIKLSAEERVWSFEPTRPWSAGSYRFMVDAVLEDLAGNNLARAFEVDIQETVTATVAQPMVSIPFAIAAKPSLASGRQVVDRMAQWHQWRGPLASGHAPKANPPVHWDEKTNIAWKSPLPGRGSSTPVVWDGRVYVTSAEPTGRKARPEDLPKQDPAVKKYTEPPTQFYRFLVLCFDAKSGKEIWRRVAAEHVPHEGHHTTHSYAAGSPTTDGERLYVSFGSAGNYCYSLEGDLVWSRDFGRLHTRLGWGEAVTPVVHAGSLLLNWDQESNSKLICLDAATGKTKWEAERNEPSTWCTPLVVESHGVTQVVLNGTNRIRSYDLATGREIWRCAGMSLNSIPSAVSDGSVVFVMSGYRGFAARAVRLDAIGEVGSSTGVNGLVWKHDRGTPYVPSPLLVGDRLYFTQANIAVYSVLDATTGKALLDRARLPAVNAFYASPIAAADRIYLAERGGTTLVLKRTDKLDVLATNVLADGFDASPAPVGDRLFLRGTKWLYCLRDAQLPD